MSLSGFVMSDAGGHAINYFGLYELPLLLKDMKFFASYAHDIHAIAAPIGCTIIGLHIVPHCFITLN